MIDISDVTKKSGRSGGVVANRLRVPKASEILANQIKQQIVQGDLCDGDHLPAESNLMQQFDVSRPTIREAYRILEAEQLVTVARGAKGGAIVHVPTSQLITDYALLVLQSERATVNEVYQARNAFEPALIRLIIYNNRDQAVSVLTEAIKEEEASVSEPKAFAKALAGFHHALIELSGNRPMAHLYGCINEVIERHQAMVVTLRHHGVVKGDEPVSPGLNSHRKLVRLIGKGMVDEAESHWRQHNEMAYEAWITGFEATTVLEIMSE
ncbi:MAG: transcriptional regulator [Cellvibrionaceae bacterium]|nr:transcriptional regulator [Cellvibrionaceae bacterium]|tara:strand:+ start:53018 stop:53821 length:804 start_codon:yes stop_codon:yes gene_type:complete